MKKTKNIERFKFYGGYTVLFTICMICTSLYFIYNKSTFIWSVDGISQHYNALAYYGEYLRDILWNLFEKHSIIIPTYDFSIGYGADVLNTLHYYVIGDPLNLLAVFVPKEHTEILFHVLVILRIYLAGITFSVFARSRGNRSSAVLAGVPIYLFSEYVLYFFCKHPFFLNPLIYFPLILLGVDRIYRKKGPGIYIVALIISACSNFYFFYMLGILTVIYAVFQYFGFYHSIQWKTVFRLLLKFGLYTILAICAAGVFLLPSLGLLFQTGRMSNETTVPLLYGIKYYARFFSGFISMDSPGHQTFLGYTVIAFPAVILLFATKGEKLLKTGFVLLTGFLCIPFIAHVFNGMSYVTNRWAFGYTMLVAYIVVKMYPVFLKLCIRQKIILIVFTVLELLACMAGIAGKYLVGEETKLKVMTILLFLLILFVAVLCMSKKQKNPGKIFFTFVMCMNVGCVLINALDVRTREADANRFIQQGSAQRQLENIPSAELGEFSEEKNSWRYDEEGTGEIKNSTLQTGLYGTSFYFSMANPYVAEYQSSLYWNNTQEQSYRGADKRSALEILGGVKYFVTPKERKGPGAYQEKKNYVAGEKEFTIWDSGKKLPFVFAYDKYIGRDEFEQLNIEQKQQALMEAVVLERDKDIGDWDKEYIVSNDAKEPETIWTSRGKIKLEENMIQVQERGATLNIQTDIQDEGEVYLIFEGLEYEDGGASSGISRTKSKITINITQNKIKKKIVFNNANEFAENNGKNNFLCNLEMNEPGKKEIEIKFPYTGTYRFKNIRVVVQPVEKIIKNAENLEKGVDGWVCADGNEVKASLELEEPRLVCLAVPFDKGWTAVVDGKKAELMQANIMYMALPLEEGKHEIELHYSNPFICTGAIISVIGILGAVICITGNYVKRRRK